MFPGISQELSRNLSGMFPGNYLDAGSFLKYGMFPGRFNETIWMQEGWRKVGGIPGTIWMEEGIFP
jgi:hypothetical protein